MARKSTLIGILPLQNVPQALIVIVIVGIVIGLILFNIFAGRKPAPTPTPAPEQEQQESKFTPIQLPTTHKVTFGETLAKLSTKYYNDTNLWPGIAKANELKKPSLINPNSELKIPIKEEAQKVKISDLRTTGKDKIAGEKYTVDYGDTLFEISQRAYGDGSKWTLVDQANKLGRLPNGNPLIHAGNVLVIPR